MPYSSGRRRPEEVPVATSPQLGGTKKKRRRDPLWARLVVVFGAVLMMVSGGAIVGVRAIMAKVNSSINNENLLGDAGVDKGTSIKGPLNVLLVGVDERPDNDEPVRADSILILHVPATHDQAYLVSLPRDLLVEIPAFKENNIAAQRGKINAAFALGSEGKGGRAGGFKLLATTIKRVTGIEFNAGAIIDFGGFQKVVEQLGGVDMCIDQKVISRHIGFDKNGNYRRPFHGPEQDQRDPLSTPVTYEPGCRRLKPWEALDYVRQRKGLQNGDYDRQRHQQQFVKAMLKEAKKQGVTTNPKKALDIIGAAGKALTVDTQGVGIDSWAYTLRNVTDKELLMLKTNGGKVNSIMDPSLGSCELLTDESRAMFQAMRGNRVAQFVAEHPDFVNGDAVG